MRSPRCLSVVLSVSLLTVEIILYIGSQIWIGTSSEM
jgi:hypothetical protein